jgi:hypothetical protein
MKAMTAGTTRGGQGRPFGALSATGLNVRRPPCRCGLAAISVWQAAWGARPLLAAVGHWEALVGARLPCIPNHQNLRAVRKFVVFKPRFVRRVDFSALGATNDRNGSS